MPDCPCTERELRKRTCANGAVQYVRQCVVCGQCSNPLKQAELSMRQKSAAPDVDPDLQTAWARQQWRDRYNDSDSEWAVKRAEYHRYLLTGEWRAKSRAVLLRDNWTCQARLPGCTDRATQAHHLTYLRIYQEPLFDLVAVCAACHRALHPDGDNGPFGRPVAPDE